MNQHRQALTSMEALQRRYKTLQVGYRDYEVHASIECNNYSKPARNIAIVFL
jgi:hypothetical protein